jgi:hypothetical protein
VYISSPLIITVKILIMIGTIYTTFKEKPMLRKWVMFSCFILVLFLLPVSAGLAQTTNTVRAVWNNSALVLINISSEGVDVSELGLQNDFGEILPSTWEIKTDENGEDYSLTDVRPGSCLIIYVGSATDADLPPGASCTRVVADMRLADINDLVWDVSRGGFTPVLAGVEGDLCAVDTGTSCDIAVNPANTNVGGGIPDEVTVRALWTNDILVLINISGYGADLTGLTLTGATGGEIAPGNWVMAINPDDTTSYDLDNVRPGSCLVAYLSVRGTDRAVPALPENVDCTRMVALFTPRNLDDLVWTLDVGSFTPSVDGTDGEACTWEGTTSCDFSVPNADLNPDDGEEETAVEPGVPVVRALWNNDIFVIINVSGDGVDLSGLSLEGVDNDGAILPENWVMAVDPVTTASYTLTDVRPGSCLVAYLSVAGTDEVAPELPAGVACDQIIGEFTVTNLADLVWTLEANGFTPVVGGSEGEACDIIGRSSCDIPLE